MFIRIIVVILYWYPSCNQCLKNSKKHQFTHSSKKAWNNFWHFSASSSLIIWPAFWFAPGSIRSILNQVVLQSYNDVLSVPSTTRVLAEVFARNAVPCDCFAPPGTNQMVAFLGCVCNWVIVANHFRAFCSG